VTTIPSASPFHVDTEEDAQFATFIVDLDILSNEVLLFDWFGSPQLSVSGIATASHNSAQAIRFTLDNAIGGPTDDARGESGRLIVKAGFPISVLRVVSVPDGPHTADYDAVAAYVKSQLRSDRKDLAVRVISEC
jgi:hypothetical protein